MAVVGYAALASWQSGGGRLLRSWFIVSCIGFFAAPYAEWWRFLYFIPLEILAAMGLVRILELALRFPSHVSGSWSRYSPTILLILISLLAGAASTLSTIQLTFIPLIVAALTLATWPNSFDLETATLLFVVSIILFELTRAFYVMV